MKAEFSLRRFENGEHTAGTPEVKQPTAAGRDVLVVASAGAKKVAELVIASTEALRGREALEPAHTSRASFYAAVVLLEPVIFVGAGSVLEEPCPSVVTWSGVTPVTALAERKKACAAAMSRCSLSMTSTRWPSRSMARYRILWGDASEVTRASLPQQSRSAQHAELRRCKAVPDHV